VFFKRKEGIMIGTLEHDPKVTEAIQKATEQGAGSSPIREAFVRILESMVDPREVVIGPAAGGDSC